MTSKNIKLATKKKFQQKLLNYKKIIREDHRKMDLKYFKKLTNLSILDSRLHVLYEKGMFKNAENAKKIIQKYNNLIKISNDIFLSKTKEIIESKVMSKKDPKLKEKLLNGYIKDYHKEITELSKRGLEVNFIEEMNPIIKSFITNLENKYKKVDSKLN